MSKQLTVQQQADAAILKELERLAGGRTSDDHLIFQGDTLIIPETMTAGDAITFLENHRASNEKRINITRVFNYRPWDGAAALARALKKITGNAAIAVSQWSFFGEIKPELRTVNISADETLQVPWGQFAIPMWVDEDGDPGFLTTSATHHTEYGLVFRIVVEAPRKYKQSVEGLLQAVDAELRTASIYRGKAIDGQEDPQFLDLRGLDPESVVYSDEVITQLGANIWSVLEHTQQYRDLGIARKRAVLLEGPYGTGKTLGAFLTALKATQNGWTFLYCRPGRDDLQQTLATARLYQPSVVFFEDVDTVSSTADDDQITKLLDMFDGISAKGTEIMAILTTNHAERIHKGMVRPGRLDAIIHIGELDAAGVGRMLDSVVPPHLIDRDTLDVEAIYKAMDGYMPAFVKEAVERALRYNLARNNGVPSILTTSDFVDAAVGLRAQFNLMQEAGFGKTRAPLDEVFHTIAQDAVEDVLARTSLVDADGNPNGQYGAFFAPSKDRLGKTPEPAS